MATSHSGISDFTALKAAYAQATASMTKNVDRVAGTLQLRQRADPGPIGVHQVPVGQWMVAAEAGVDEASCLPSGDQAPG